MTNELKYKTFEDMPTRAVFNPEEIANGDLGAFITKLTELKPDTVELIASDSETPEGWGVAVVGISETRDVTETSESGVSTTSKKRIPTKVVIWAVPTIAALQADSQGLSFVLAAVNKEMAHQIARPFRLSDMTVEQAMQEAPASIADFATRRAAESQFKVYNELAPAVITMLKGIEGVNRHPFVRRISKPMLREVLESAAAATALSAELEEAKLWDNVLDNLISFAEAQDLSSQVFHDWKAKRHNVETLDIGTIDLSGLALKVAPVAADEDDSEAGEAADEAPEGEEAPAE